MDAELLYPQTAPETGPPPMKQRKPRVSKAVKEVLPNLSILNAYGGVRFLASRFLNADAESSGMTTLFMSLRPVCRQIQK